MKRLVLCFDGTWNSFSNPKELSNVVKIANTVSATASDGTPQICYYNSGVGSGGPIDRFTGGVFGAGLRSNVQRGLIFLALNYRAGDEIYLFGFSRGAYTARALAGVLGVAGIPSDIMHAGKHWDNYRQIAKLQSDNRGRDKNSRRYKESRKEIKRLRRMLFEKPKDNDDDAITLFTPSEINIVCVGVFDTVGSYGVPVGWLSGLARAFTYWTRAFHSREIGKAVRVALHAMAIDEMRRPFYPTFWMQPVKPKPGQEPIEDNDRDEDEKALALRPEPKVEQTWFAGVHCNVGGSYEDSGLSDVALAWMISRVTEHTKLEFDESELMKVVWPCSAAMLYRTSRGGPLARVRSVLPRPSNGRLAQLLLAVFRPLNKRLRFRRPRLGEDVHWSVEERFGLPAALVQGGKLRKYKPKNLRHPIDRRCDKQALESRLLARTPDEWKAHCPLKGIGPCHCAERPEALAAAEQATRPQAA